MTLPGGGRPGSATDRPDLLVVGGGIIGLASAWQAARRGASVTVVDERFGSGATFAAAGMIAPVSEAHFGEEALLALNIASAAAWPAFAAKLAAAAGAAAVKGGPGDPVAPGGLGATAGSGGSGGPGSGGSDSSGALLGYRRDGTLAVAVDAGDRAVLDELWKFQAGLGLDSRRLGPSECRELEPLLAPGLRGGLLVPGEDQVDPRLVAAALQVACRDAGVTLIEDSVSRILTSAEGNVTGARLGDSGEVLAGEVLLAAGWRSASLNGLPPAAAPPVRAVKGQILHLRLPPGLPSPVRTIRAVVRGHSVYVVPRAGSELVCGATVEELGSDTRVTAGAVYELLRDAQAVLPAVSEAELVETSVGLRPGSPDNAPLIGRGAAPGLLLATGHFRHGILLAPITAELVAALVGDPAAELPDWAAAVDPRRFAALAPAGVGGRHDGRPEPES